MSRSIVFAGSDSKVGTTMTVQSIAEHIVASDRSQRVLLAGFHGRSGTDYAGGAVATLDQIRIPLEHGLLSREALLDVCRRNQRLCQLGGISDRLDRRRYGPEVTGRILDLLGDAFDLILIDAGNDLDDGLAVGAIRRADEGVLLLAQCESALRHHEEAAPLARRLGFAPRLVVLNRYRDKDPYDLRYVAKRLERPTDQILRLSESPADRSAEKDGRSLYAVGGSRYREEIRTIADRVVVAGPAAPHGEKRRRSWKPFI